MKKRIKRILLVIGIIVLIFCVIIGYFVYKDFQQEEVLKQEVINLSNKDLVNSNYDISIKTTGDYAYVENAIKKFYKELSDNVKVLYYYLDDDDLIHILSIENLDKDKPIFLESYKVIGTAKTNTTKALQTIISLCSEEKIKNLLDKDKVDDYYVDFYQKLMYTEHDLKAFADTRKEMEELSTNLNLFFDKIQDMLDLLKQNNGNWFIEHGQLYFNSDSLVDEYNRLYEELNKIATEKIGDGKIPKTTPKDDSI